MPPKSYSSLTGLTGLSARLQHFLRANATWYACCRFWRWHPPLLVLDEPFAGLDLPTKTYLQNLLYGLDQSVLHITHDLQALAEYERVIWLEKGQVVGDGLPKHIIPTFENAMAQIEQI